MNRLYIVRHCEAAGQEPSAPLTDRGMHQSLALADWFVDYPVDFIVSSPYVRAVDTIRPLAERLKLDVLVDQRLGERVLCDVLLPDWKEKLRETFGDLDLKLPGGESSREAMNRALEVVRELSAKEQNVLLVTHGNLLALLLTSFDNHHGYETWAQLSNPDVYVVEQKQSGHLVHRIWPSPVIG